MLQDLIRLHSKYVGNLPRYTSYPTAVEFKAVENQVEAEQRYQAAIADLESFSLYIHLPFCPSLCYFCACNKVITQDTAEIDRYLEALTVEADLLKAKLPLNAKILQVHLGGGSPSYLSCEQLERLQKIVTSLSSDMSSCQYSVEIDPRTSTPQKLALLYQQGYRRFSLGVQDFDSKVQELVNRIQPYDLTAGVLKEIRRNSDTEVNFDLIYGLPGQTETGFKDTINKVIELRPDRIALYGYAHVTWKVKVQNALTKYGLPEPLERIHFFAAAVELLEAAGYIYIGMDHFALPQDELSLALTSQTLRRNFMGYTTVHGQALLGLGPSAISDLGSCLFQNALSVENYKQHLERQELPISRVIKRHSEDSVRAFMIESLMCHRILTLAELQLEFPHYIGLESIFRAGQQELQRYALDRLVELEIDTIHVTSLGAFFMRQLVSVFDAYLKELDQSEKRFSAAV